ncbi:MAG: hypothetical protein CME32_30260 [Gimesia sp.]|nr:hypothetical protein [Gimesia sp.]MBN73558.1 hypothetical protein [Gimesia sp.]HAH46756.1 hypothetical protein [Planctomycetaceae bacterium]HAW29118.1 hypothetical protein [Planctomycetaceae bacterium]
MPLLVEGKKHLPEDKPQIIRLHPTWLYSDHFALFADQKSERKRQKPSFDDIRIMDYHKECYVRHFGSNVEK